MSTEEPCIETEFEQIGDVATSQVESNPLHPAGKCKISSRDKEDPNNKKFDIEFEGVAAVKWLPKLEIDIDSDAESVTGTVRCIENLAGEIDPDCDPEDAATFRGDLEIGNVKITTDGNIEFKFTKIAPGVMKVVVHQSGTVTILYDGVAIAEVREGDPEGQLNIIDGLFSTKGDLLEVMDPPDDPDPDPDPDPSDLVPGGDYQVSEPMGLYNDAGDGALCSVPGGAPVIYKGPSTPSGGSTLLLLAFGVAMARLMSTEQGRKLADIMSLSSIALRVTALVKSVLNLK